MGAALAIPEMLGSVLTGGMGALGGGAAAAAGGAAEGAGSSLMSGLGSMMGAGGIGAQPMAAASQLIPGLQFGLQDALSASAHPGGPQSAGDAFDQMSGYGDVQGALSALHGGLFGSQEGNGRWSQAMQNFGDGQTLQQGLMNAGASPFLSMFQSAQHQGLINKIGGVAGISPMTAMMLGNPLARAGLAQSGMSNVHSGGIMDSLHDSAFSLASQVAGALVPGQGGGGRGPQMEQDEEPPAERDDEYEEEEGPEVMHPEGAASGGLSQSPFPPGGVSIVQRTGQGTGSSFA